MSEVVIVLISESQSTFWYQEPPLHQSVILIELYYQDVPNDMYGLSKCELL